MKLEYLKQDHTFLREINIYKILIYELEPGQQKQAQEFIDNLSEIGYTSSDERLLDISALGINKGTGLLEEAKILNLKKENICTFGDFYNDIPFLNASGFPIAMGNSCSELKEIAYYVTKINDEDGVADAIEKFLI